MKFTVGVVVYLYVVIDNVFGAYYHETNRPYRSYNHGGGHTNGLHGYSSGLEAHSGGLHGNTGHNSNGFGHIGSARHSSHSGGHKGETEMSQGHGNGNQHSEDLAGVFGDDGYIGFSKYLYRQLEILELKPNCMSTRNMYKTHVKFTHNRTRDMYKTHFNSQAIEYWTFPFSMQYPPCFQNCIKPPNFYFISKIHVSRKLLFQNLFISNYFEICVHT